MAPARAPNPTARERRYFAGRPALLTVTCSECGGDMPPPPDMRQRVYCSAACAAKSKQRRRTERDRKRREAANAGRHCGHCGRALPATANARRLYCDDRCHTDAATARRRSDPDRAEADRARARQWAATRYATAEGRERQVAASRRYAERQREIDPDAWAARQREAVRRSRERRLAAGGAPPE